MALKNRIAALTRFWDKPEEQLGLAQVLPYDRTIPVRADETLLQAALAAQIPFPHNCRVGSCGTCKCRLLDGTVKQLTDTSYTLSAEEIESGYILACQTRLTSGSVRVAVDSVDGSTQTRRSRGTITSQISLTPDIHSVTITLEEPIRYRAGQYAELSVPQIQYPRRYSFAYAPEQQPQKTVTFFIKHVVGGEMTGWLNYAPRMGSEVCLSEAHGDFCLREGRAPILCVAGGSGLAPIKAMLEQALRDQSRRDVVLLFGARTQQDLYCMTALREMAMQWRGRFDLVPVLSNEPPASNWRGLRGYVADSIVNQRLDLSSCQAYLCGPAPMLEQAYSTLRNAGMADASIFQEKFL